MNLEPFPVVRVHEVPPTPPGARWLVEDLWAQQAVGILGGIPKVGKTWLALDLAVSVASGTPALGAFPVPQPGKVLVYAAEDSLQSVRDRIEGISRARSLPLESLASLCLLDSPVVRLDAKGHFDRLRRTLDLLHPSLLILDPLVRVHSGDENSAVDIASLLGQLRTVQREFGTAVLLVHHTRKNGPTSHPGQTLRGSGDLHAWGDDNLYLHRRNGRLTLTIEHRHASAPAPVPIELRLDPAPHLHVADSADPTLHADPELPERLLTVLADEGTAMDRYTLRQRLRTRNQTLGLALVKLRENGRIERCAGGFRLRPGTLPIPIPAPTQQRERNGPTLL